MVVSETLGMYLAGDAERGQVKPPQVLRVWQGFFAHNQRISKLMAAPLYPLYYQLRGSRGYLSSPVPRPFDLAASGPRRKTWRQKAPIYHSLDKWDGPKADSESWTASNR
jgi:hypothetical protein